MKILVSGLLNIETTAAVRGGFPLGTIPLIIRF